MSSGAESLLGSFEPPDKRAAATASTPFSMASADITHPVKSDAFRRAFDLVQVGDTERLAGNEEAATAAFRTAWMTFQTEFTTDDDDLGANVPDEARPVAIRCALECGEVAEARRLLRQGGSSLLYTTAETAIDLRDMESWPDPWLIACIRNPAPDERCLDVLARRHWPALFGRCHLLTAAREAAADLAQEVWCRVLRRRHTLKPGGNFPALLRRIATNLWRDRLRAEQRAGMLADGKLFALDAQLAPIEGDHCTLLDLLPDLAALDEAAAARLHEDLSQALARLSPLSRDVLIARYLEGESCAEMGRRFQRTEQTISGWIRRALDEVRNHLRNPLPEGRSSSSS